MLVKSQNNEREFTQSKVLNQRLKRLYYFCYLRFLLLIQVYLLFSVSWQAIIRRFGRCFTACFDAKNSRIFSWRKEVSFYALFGWAIWENLKLKILSERQFYYPAPKSYKSKVILVLILESPIQVPRVYPELLCSGVGGGENGRIFICVWIVHRLGRAREIFIIKSFGIRVEGWGFFWSLYFPIKMNNNKNWIAFMTSSQAFFHPPYRLLCVYFPVAQF